MGYISNPLIHVGYVHTELRKSLYIVSVVAGGSASNSKAAYLLHRPRWSVQLQVCNNGNLHINFRQLNTTASQYVSKVPWDLGRQRDAGMHARRVAKMQGS
eukprot:6213880-Pleurochrysis_carterae.AAC.3